MTEKKLFEANELYEELKSWDNNNHALASIVTKDQIQVFFGEYEFNLDDDDKSQIITLLKRISDAKYKKCYKQFKDL